MIRRMSGETHPPGFEYENPLITRYAGRAMRALFSARRRAEIWRDLWIALARCQQELGLGITDEQLAELEAAKAEIDLGRVAELEKELRHDVMAHVHHFGEVAPKARAVLHLGATSCFVTDNADLVLFRAAFTRVLERLATVIRRLARLAQEHADRPCLGYTHFQPAQPTTFGKRVCLWLQDFVRDYELVRRLRDELAFRGVKGTTGTQASFLDLFDGDHERVCELDRRVAERMGFANVQPITGQTYPRKTDHEILTVLSGIAQSVAKLGVDVRLLSHEGEVEEPFTAKQIGSSAMAYKRNPMRSERACSLARLVLTLQLSGGLTASTQWLERTLDDSALRRIVLPEAFLAVDACLLLVADVAGGLQVFPAMMRRHLDEHLPFLATENLMMAGVRAGGDRQDLHERLRRLAVEAARRMKQEGVDNPLVEMIRQEPALAFAHARLDQLLDARRLIGRAPQQVRAFLTDVVQPLLEDAPPEEDEELRV